MSALAEIGEEAIRPRPFDAQGGVVAVPGLDGVSPPMSSPFARRELTDPPTTPAGVAAGLSPHSAADHARALAQEIAASPSRPARPTTPPHQMRALGPFGGSSLRVSSEAAGVRVTSEAGASAGTKVLGMVRSEMANMEAELIEEMKRFRDSIVERQDKLREAELHRLEKKLLEQATTQGKLDRRISELSGMFRGLHSEVQLQIQSGDSLDKRLAELKHQLEEELRQRCTELESSQMETLSKCRASAAAGEDTQKRHGHSIRRLEVTLQDLLRKGELWSQQAAMHHERLELLEAAPRGRSALLMQGEQEAIAKVWDLERSLGDLTQQLEQLSGEVRVDRETYHSMAAQLQEYDTRIMACRSKVDGHHETLSALDEHIRLGCEEKFEVLSKSYQDITKKIFHLTERHEAVKASVDDIHAESMGLPRQPLLTMETVCEQRRPDRPMDIPLQLHSKSSDFIDTPDTVAPPPRPRAPGSNKGSEAADRVDGLGRPDGARCGKQEKSAQESSQMVGELLEKLRELAPVVIEQQSHIEEHRQAIQQLRPGAEAGLSSKEMVGGLRDELRGLRCRVADVEERVGTMPGMSYSSCLDNTVSPGARSLLPAAELHYAGDLAAPPATGGGVAEAGLRGMFSREGAPGAEAAGGGSHHQQLIKRIANMDRLMGVSSSPASVESRGPAFGSGPV